MIKNFTFFGLYFSSLLISALPSHTLESSNSLFQSGESSLVLYDAASGGVPASPLMNFTDFPPGTALSTFSDGAALLDTMNSGQDTYAGWSSNGTTTPGFPNLDQMPGFRVDFTLQVENETHSSKNRSGFSLIVLGSVAKGIELAFWENEIWAQSDTSTGGLFQHAEGVSFPTTTGLIDYQLTVKENVYTLTANTQPILSGPVRDYSAFDGFPDPYQTANFLFLGDNTTSAHARIRLQFVSVTGIESATPTDMVAVTSTSVPLPTASPAQSSSPAPVPSSTPIGKDFDICPSSSLLLTITLAGSVLRKYTRAKRKGS